MGSCCSTCFINLKYSRFWVQENLTTSATVTILRSIYKNTCFSNIIIIYILNEHFLKTVLWDFRQVFGLLYAYHLKLECIRDYSAFHMKAQRHDEYTATTKVIYLASQELAGIQVGSPVAACPSEDWRGLRLGPSSLHPSLKHSLKNLKEHFLGSV